jgi:hypothetical protein
VKKIILGGLAAAALAAPIAAVASPASAAQPTTTTHNLTVAAASEAVIDLPALNSQFTKMTIKVNDGTANWGAADLGYWTSYQNGGMTTGAPMTSGIWGDASLPGHGPLLLEGTQVGAVIYRIDGGPWQELSAATSVSTASGTHVQVAYNDRPGSYDDNYGSLSLTVVRAKA